MESDKAALAELECLHIGNLVLLPGVRRILIPYILLQTMADIHCGSHGELWQGSVGRSQKIKVDGICKRPVSADLAACLSWRSLLERDWDSYLIPGPIQEDFLKDCHDGTCLQLQEGCDCHL